MFLSGIATDLVVYSIIIPVMPFRLEYLGYTSVSPLVGWLLFSYVCINISSIQVIEPNFSLLVLLSVSSPHNYYAL